MNDDEIRRALAAYATGAPEASAGLGGRARALRAKRVRTAAAGAAVVAIVATATTAVAVHGGGTSRLSPVADPTPSATVESPSPTAEPTVAPAMIATAHGAEGLNLTATLMPGGLATAVVARLDVAVTDDDGSPRVTEIEWGDGVKYGPGYPLAMCPYLSPPPSHPPRAKQPGHVSETFRHSWRRPGTYTVYVHTRSMLQCIADPPPMETAIATLTVRVTPGASVANGAMLPHFDDPQVVPYDNDPLHVTFNGGLHDEDGFVENVVVDWGDGTPRETVALPDDPCDDGHGTHFPVTDTYAQAEHTYARAGTYPIEVTFVSTGCDGSDAQTGTRSVRKAIG